MTFSLIIIILALDYSIGLIDLMIYYRRRVPVKVLSLAFLGIKLTTKWIEIS